MNNLLRRGNSSATVALPQQKMRFPLRAKLGLAFIPLLLAFLFNGILAIGLLLYSLEVLALQSNRSVYLERVQRFQLAYSSEYEFYSNAIFFSATGGLFRNPYRQIITDDMMRLSQVEKTENSLSANTRNEQKFAQLYYVAYTHFTNFDDLITAGKMPEVRQKWNSVQNDLIAVSKLIDDWRKNLLNEREDGNNELSQTVFVSIGLIVFVSLSSGGLTIALLLLSQRLIVHPLNLLRQALWKVAQEGDLSQQVNIRNQDEIGQLAQSFQAAVGSLQKVLEGVQISNDLQNIARQLGEVSGQQAVGSQEQVTALAQVRHSMHELSGAAEHIERNVEEVDNLTGTTQLQIQKVADAEQASREYGKQMSASVTDTLEGVEYINGQINGLHETMRGLNEQAHAIGTIVSLINNISGEIHLLSLNAAIEAAGAGQQGERFGIVAREVRGLAQRTNNSVEQVRTLVRQVQASSLAALEQTTESLEEIQKINTANSGLRGVLAQNEALNGQVAEAVTILENLAQQISGQTLQIRQATRQQTATSRSVFESSKSVEEIATQNVEFSGQLTGNSAQLDTLTRQLDTVLRQMRLQPTQLY